jgi:hypothetical protein
LLIRLGLCFSTVVCLIELYWVEPLQAAENFSLVKLSPPIALLSDLLSLPLAAKNLSLLAGKPR